MAKELVDLVDNDGIIRVKSVDRVKAGEFTHLHLAIVIGVIFDSLGNILVQRRSLMKKSAPGLLDHICGALLAGETPEDAFIRESLEETGVRLSNIELVTKGVNVYGRYRYLFRARSDDQPLDQKTSEIEWARFISFDELTSKYDSGEWEFVKDFFEDMRFARSHK